MSPEEIKKFFESIRTLAALTKGAYDAYIEQGFTDLQALELAKATTHFIMKGGN